MSAARSLIPISISTLLPGSILGFDVFVRSANGLPSQKLNNATEALSASVLQEYVNAKVTVAFIHADESHHYQGYLQEKWQLILVDDVVPLDTRLEIMSDVVRSAVDRQFQGDDIDSLVKVSNQVAESTVQLLGSYDVALSQLCSVLHHDYGTFTHSANVSFFATLLAKELGYQRSEQHEIAVGALLHDIGKLAIDSKIINKPGPLNLRELSQMKRHPILGFERLASHEDVTFNQLMMTYQHHERCDGSGYPCGIPSKHIHPHAKLCAIVDVFEALTSLRPYRKPLSLRDATDFLLNRRDSEFDPEMLDAWIALANREELCHA